MLEVCHRDVARLLRFLCLGVSMGYRGRFCALWSSTGSSRDASVKFVSVLFGRTALAHLAAVCFFLSCFGCGEFPLSCSLLLSHQTLSGRHCRMWTLISFENWADAGMKDFTSRIRSNARAIFVMCCGDSTRSCSESEFAPCTRCAWYWGQSLIWKPSFLLTMFLSHRLRLRLSVSGFGPILLPPDVNLLRWQVGGEFYPPGLDGPRSSSDGRSPSSILEGGFFLEYVARRGRCCDGTGGLWVRSM